MSELKFSTYEFMAIMGFLEQDNPDSNSVFYAWKEKWINIAKHYESLPPMQRADLLFDGKITIHAITQEHLHEIVHVVKQLLHEQKALVKKRDPDADEDDVAMWQECHDSLLSMN